MNLTWHEGSDVSEEKHEIIICHAVGIHIRVSWDVGTEVVGFQSVSQMASQTELGMSVQ